VDIAGDLLAQIPIGDRTDDALRLAGRADQSIDQAVDRFDAARPALGRSSKNHTL
jgi:hypothetical protein